MGSFNLTGLLYILLFRIWYLTTDKSSRDMINFHFKRVL
jgi:hypothetical protein